MIPLFQNPFLGMIAIHPSWQRGGNNPLSDNIFTEADNLAENDISEKKFLTPKRRLVSSARRRRSPNKEREKERKKRLHDAGFLRRREN